MKKAIGIGAAFIALALTVYPAVSIAAATNALALCAGTLVPSLFPFFICANLLIASGITASVGRLFEAPSRFLFHVGGEGAVAALLGFISGYPAGAAVTCRLYAGGSISRAEAHRLLAFTNNAGPLFVIGAVGTAVYGHPPIGYLLLASQTLASLATGFCMRFYGANTPHPRINARGTVSDPVGEAIHTVLTLCGFVVFFSVVTAFLEHLGILRCIRRLLSALGMGEKTAALCVAGTLEISAITQNSGALPATAALLSFGGLSVLLQTASLVKKVGLSMKSYLVGKFLSAGLSAFFCRLLVAAFPPAVSVVALAGHSKAVVYTGYLGAALLLTAIPCLLYFIRKRLQEAESCVTIKKKDKRGKDDYILQ